MFTRYVARIRCLKHLENLANGGEGKKKNSTMKADNKEFLENKRFSVMKPDHTRFLATKRNNKGLREDTMTRRFSALRD